jgi:hypothetical protein
MESLQRPAEAEDATRDEIDAEQLLNLMGLASAPAPRPRTSAPSPASALSGPQGPAATVASSTGDKEPTAHSGESRVVQARAASPPAIPATAGATPGHGATAGASQSYEEFRTSLNMPPSCSEEPMPTPLPAFDPMAAVCGAMIMDASRRRAARAQAAEDAAARATQQQAQASTAASLARSEADCDELCGLESIELAPGATRDVTKSPQHHRLKLDNFVGSESESEEEEGVDGGRAAGALGGSAPPNIGGEVVSPTAPALAIAGAQPTPLARPPVDARAALAAAAAASEDDADVSEEEGEWVDEADAPPASGMDSPTSPATSAEFEWVGSSSASSTSQSSTPQATGSSPTSKEPSPAAKPPVPPLPQVAHMAPTVGSSEGAFVEGEREEEAVVAFALDPDYDYDRVAHTERFSVARARVEGEFYDCDGEPPERR